ncbi:hypothetical protein KC19_4G241200 [Ceratodon purpureus]|uniref:Uncharacterized protein n=1 Tax=Ceratodon purpureus TaxID=3225 RepID=A0A8T0ID17_CERPU|nr:hypothetical protein KC19_4G241200 [Ceratodon purpureus]
MMFWLPYCVLDCISFPRSSSKITENRREAIVIDSTIDLPAQAFTSSRSTAETSSIRKRLICKTLNH